MSADILFVGGSKDSIVHCGIKSPDTKTVIVNYAHQYCGSIEDVEEYTYSGKWKNEWTAIFILSKPQINPEDCQLCKDLMNAKWVDEINPHECECKTCGVRMDEYYEW